jgi:tripartite-type tricarboxylate transporter receptor subunit TctC
MKRLFCLWTILLLGAPQAFAAYPDRPVHIVIGSPPGTGGDTLTRLVATKLSQKWGQPVLVENRTGASNTLAEGLVAHAAPDGYTLVMVNATHTVTPSTIKLIYDPIKSFSPVSRLVIQPDVLLVQSSLGAKTVMELVALAKAEPGKIYFGTSGVGGAPYLAMKLLLNGTGTDMHNINYPGSPDALLALQRGEVQVAFGSVHDTLPLVKNGKVRALAVSSAIRVNSLKDLPTMAEATGLADYDVAGWQGILAPAGTPQDIITKIHDDLVAVTQSTDFRDEMTRRGAVIVASSPEEFETFVEHDIQKWQKLLKPDDGK